MNVSEWIDLRRRVGSEQWANVETRAKIRAALNFASGDDLDRIAQSAGVAIDHRKGSV